MQEINESIVQLLYRRLHGLPMSASENQELDAWLAQSEYNRRVYDNFRDEEWLREAKKIYEAPGKEAGLQQLRARLFAGKAPVRPLRVFAKYAVAASILALVSIAGYKYLQMPSEVSRQMAANDVTHQLTIDPGGEAILTLSNGTRTHLHKAADGVLAQLGNGRQLIKQDGKLVYPSVSTQSTAEPAGLTAGYRSDQYALVLADGSRVWLNRGSRLVYPESFNGDVRMIELQGEAYFEVAKMQRGSEKVPFIVKVPSENPGEEPYHVEVLGTHFNIKAHKGEPIRTTLAEGSVRVKKGALQSLLKPNDQAILNADKTLEVKHDVAVADVLAWKDNKFVYRGENVYTVMQEIKRWYNIEYIIKGNFTHQISFTSDRSKPLPQVLKDLEKQGLGRFEFDQKENQIVVRP